MYVQYSTHHTYHTHHTIHIHTYIQYKQNIPRQKSTAPKKRRTGPIHPVHPVHPAHVVPRKDKRERSWSWNRRRAKHDPQDVRLSRGKGRQVHTYIRQGRVSALSRWERERVTTTTTTTGSDVVRKCVWDGTGRHGRTVSLRSLGTVLRSAKPGWVVVWILHTVHTYLRSKERERERKRSWTSRCVRALIYCTVSTVQYIHVDTIYLSIIRWSKARTEI